MNGPRLAGHLEVFSPIHVLRLLQNTRVTGRLEFVRRDACVNLFIEDGLSVTCSSTGTRLHLGEILVRQGNLRPEVVELALAVQSDMPGKRIGHILVESGSVTEAQVREALAAFQRQILCDALLWQSGTFQFLLGETAPADSLRIAFDVDRLVMGLLTFAGGALANELGPHDS
jgi:hypothetical protein